MAQIHWLNAINSSFTNAADWSGGVIPGASDDAILDAVGSAFTVTSAVHETVESVQLAANATLSLTGGTFNASAGTGAGANAGVILVGAGATLHVGGTVTNSGTIALDGSAGGAGEATLSFNFITTLTGGGEILLGGSDDTFGPPMRGNSAVYNIDNTIAGSGTIAKKLEVVNEEAGIIDANGVAPLVVRGDVGNDGLIEATGSGGLKFKKAVLGNRTTGVVLAGAGSKVELVRSAVVGGTLDSTGSGIFTARDARFDGGTSGVMTLDANLRVVGYCDFSDTIENNGTIALSRGGFGVVGPVTLEGDGIVDLGGRGIDVSGSGASLTLQNGTIRGAGEVLGLPSFPVRLALGAAGVIDGDAKAALTLNTYASILNAGTIESTGAGGIVIDDAVINSGLLSADAGTISIGAGNSAATIVNGGLLSVESGGTLVAYNAVSGTGSATIDGGSLEFLSRFNQQVTFTGKSGTLELAKSQAFTRTIRGFSKLGKTELDLGDIAFVGSGEATFSGTSTSGVLTVTDGTNTAHITLKGDYLGATFVASSDGAGGTDVVANMAGARPPHAFVAAMAALAARPGAGAGLQPPRIDPPTMLSAPRACVA